MGRFAVENIKVKMLADIEPPELIDRGDWVDLRAAETVIISKGTFKYIPLGVAMQLPNGYEALMVPRSSLFKRHGLIQANSVGVIDESYCGENDQWHFPAYATRDTTINKGERICQFRIIEHQPRVEIKVVDALNNENRGGLGSTGEF